MKAGDREAFEKLYNRYFQRLVAVARQRLQGNRARRMTDEEDVVATAMHSFWQGVERGQFVQLENRDNLWPLLVVIAIRKAINAVDKEGRRRPREGRVHGDSIFAGTEGEHGKGLDAFLRKGPTEQSLAELDEQCERLLGMLKDDVLRQVALLKLEGFTRDEIGQQLGLSRATIARKLQLIRKTWAKQLHCAE